MMENLLKLMRNKYRYSSLVQRRVKSIRFEEKIILKIRLKTLKIRKIVLKEIYRALEKIKILR